jgi:hypothetical protein
LKYKYNLVVKTATVATVDIDADELVLVDASGNRSLLSSIDLTVNLVASGANGLDTGAEASSTMYYAWVIYNPTTSTKAGLLSLSATSPTLPSGYTDYRCVGEVYNDSSSDLVLSKRNGDEVWFEDPQAVYSAATLTTSYAAQTIPSAITTSAIKLICEASSSNANWATLQCLYAQSSAKHEVTIVNYGYGFVASNVGPTTGHHSIQFMIPYDGNGSIYAKVNSSVSYAYQNLHIWGYVCQR